MSVKNSNDTLGNQTRDRPACSAVLQPTDPPQAPTNHVQIVLLDVWAGLRPDDSLVACLGTPALGVHRICAKLPRTFNYLVLPSLHIVSLTYYFLLSFHLLSFFRLVFTSSISSLSTHFFFVGVGYIFPLERENKFHTHMEEG